jgi:hypothetical protein
MCEAKNNWDTCLQYLAFWLNSTYSHVSNKDECSILLVGTHRDLVRTAVEHLAISKKLCTAFEHCSFWKCVCKPLVSIDVPEMCFFPVDNTGTVNTTGITSALKTINLLAEKQVNARQEKPLRWLKVLDELQELAQTVDCIDWLGSSSRSNTPASGPNLSSIAKSHGVTDSAEFEALTAFFDSIGIFKLCHSRSLSFKRCQDVIILRPQWMVNVFSAVISCCHQKQCADDPFLPSTLSQDFYRYESKAILSVRLLRHLWEQKGVVEPLEGVEEETQWRANFELLVELLLRFDLMFELRDMRKSDDFDSRLFLVPAMLTKTDTLSAVSRRKCAPVLPALHCYFVFKEEGASSVRGSGGLLPSVVFAKLQAKCACWAQATSNSEPRLSHHRAEVTFGVQQFDLQLVQESCTIEVVLRVYTQPGAIIYLLQQLMLDEILAESFPSLTYETNVRDSESGNHLPLERVRLELATRTELAAIPNSSNTNAVLDTFKFRGHRYECAQFRSWLSETEIDGKNFDSSIVDNVGLYDIFICAHDGDLEFVHRLMDCLARQTGGRIRIKCSSRVTVWSPGRTKQSRALGQDDQDDGMRARQDLFAISNSVVFVPGETLDLCVLLFNIDSSVQISLCLVE